MLAVRLHAVANFQIEELARRATEARELGERDGALEADLRIIGGVLNRFIAVPTLALRPSSVFGGKPPHPHDLTGVRRAGHGAGLRVFYLAKEGFDETFVLMLLRRHEGTGAYAGFAERLRAGDFDDAFERMGIARPPG